MKKFCTILLLFCLLPLSAFANSWGLKGDLYEAVSAVDTWNDYSTISKQRGDIAVMGSRYHHALMLVENGSLAVYPTAVYQPDGGEGKRPTLTGDHELFTLSYGDEERYTFEKVANGYCLTHAAIGDFEISLVESTSCYEAKQGNETITVQQEFPLACFNIDLFPRTLEEVRHMNYMRIALSEGENFFGQQRGGVPYGVCLYVSANETVPVTSAPFGTSAWRAAKGKAAVSLKDEIWVYGIYRKGDGQDTLLLRYNVSERTQRFGFIPAEILPDADALLPTLAPMEVPLRSIQATYLTDDPLVSQFHQFEVPEGVLFTCMAVLNDYAYVSVEVKDDQFIDGGEIVWGFVPLRDLDLF